MDSKKLVNRLLSLALCLAMVLSYLPGISLDALAESVEVGTATGEVAGEVTDATTVPEETLPEDVFTDTEPVEEQTDPVETTVPEETEAEIYVSGTTEDGLSWELDTNGHLTITGSGQINEAPWEAYVDNIYTVSLSDGITAIGEYAFNGCGYMKSIDVPDSVTSIGQWAFGYCYSLSVFAIPEGVTVIEPYTFYDCEALESIVIPEGVTTIGHAAFLECESLTQVTIPDSVITVADFAFSHNYNLTTMIVGSGVESFGKEMFVYASNLKIVRFKGDAPTFGEDCFYGVAPVVYYPRNNSTWTDDVMQGYSGSPVWTALGAMQGIRLVDGDTVAVAVGDELTAEHIQAEEVYENDVCFPLEFEKLTITGYEAEEVGRYPFTVSYGDHSVTATAAVHSGRTVQTVDPALYPESSHFYSNNINEYKTLSLPGATSITLTFSESSITEDGYDFVYIYDGAGKQYGCFDGTLGGIAVTVPGDKVVIRLYTDGSATRWGYSFSQIKADIIDHSGAETPALDPTCEEDGCTAGIFCDICQLSYGVTVLPALGHCYDGVMTPPTLETQGYTTYTCVNCGGSYVDNYTTYDNVANGVCGENLTWKMDYEGNLVVSGTGEMYEYGYDDTMNWKDVPYEIKTVVIEEGVTSVSDYAFNDCPQLTSVKLADSVETIGYDAFYYAYNLTDLDLGNGVKTIRDYAFNNCYNLPSVNIPDSVETIGYGAFQYCTALSSLTVGSGVTEIGGNAFRSIAAETVVLPEGLQIIGEAAFNDCDRLEEVSIPSSVNSIGENAFQNCDSLLAINVHADNADYSSDSCGVLFDKNQTQLIQFPSGLGGEYSIPGTVTEIHTYAFSNSDNLTAVTVPDSVLALSAGVFSDCDGLISVQLGNGLTEIAYYAFYDCDALKSISIPGSVTDIGNYAFCYCGNLESVRFGSGLTTVGYRAFASCDDLATLTFTGDAPSIYYNAFDYVTATACYPMNNTTWTEDILIDYYGSITWVALGAVTGFEVAQDLIMLAVDGSLNSENLQAVALYEGDVRMPVSFAELTVSSFDASATGRQEVTVSWNGYSDTVTVAIHNGDPNYPVDPTLYPESAHNYGNNLNETKTLTVPGAKSLTLTFSAESYTETCDYIYIYDGQDNLIGTYYGSIGARTVTVEGDTVKIRLYTDGSVTYYGYSFSSITADTIEHTGDATEALAPTCTADGYTAGVYCTICEDYVRTVLPALGHSYSGVSTDPTPDTQGYTTYTCENCGDSYEDNYISYDNVANGVCGENLTWKLSFDGVLTISGTGDMYSYYDGNITWKDTGYEIRSVVIESGVTGIGCEAFSDLYELTDVTIGSDVTAIGDYAFAQCQALTAVVIPDSVTTLGTRVFQNCSQMTAVTLGAGVSTLGEAVFWNCGLTNINVDANNQNFCVDENGILYDIDKKMVIKAPANLSGVYQIPTGVTSIEAGAFAYCNGLTAVTIPEGVTVIKDSAFACCTGLAGVTIPNTVTSIETEAFRACYELTAVTIPDSVTWIGTSAFVNCTKLSSVTIGGNVETISYSAFAYCYELETVTFTGNAPTEIYYDAFRNVSATVYYPMNNTTWTADKQQNYYGSLNWVAVGEIIGIELAQDMIVLCVGETLTESHIQAQLIREGGTYSDIPFSSLTVSACDTSAVGRQEVTVYYGNYSATVTVAVHEGGAEQTVDASLYPESNHPYENNLNETKSITVPGALSLTLTFSDSTTTENNYDYITVLDKNGNRVAEYCGSNIAGTVVTVPGDTAQIRLSTDGSSTWWGYSFSSITAYVINHVGEEMEGLDATCTADGYTDYVYCDICQAEANKTVLPALGHSYDAVVTDPTSSTGGYTTFTCTACGDSYVGEYTTYDNVANGECGNDLRWVLNFEGTLTISGTGSMYGYNSNTQPWGNLRFPVKKVVIEEGVTSIGQYAFINCEELAEIELPTTLTSIGYGAFNNCCALTSIEIPDSVTAIGGYAFLNCSSLSSVQLPAGLTQISYGTFMNCTALTGITIPETVSYIDGEVFYGCTALTEITVPAGITTIEYNTFQRCTALTQVHLPENLTAIYSAAFADCSSLESIEIPAGVTTLGSSAFSGCTALTQVNIPAGITTISNSLFENCDSLTSIELPANITAIDGGAFYDCDGLVEITIPEGVTEISWDVFSNCDALTSVTLPESLESLGSQVFIRCANLTQITLPSNLKEIGRYCFNSCRSLESIEIPASITRLYEGTFGGCYQLKNITIPNTVVSIDSWCFHECEALKSITIPDSVSYLGSYSFYSSSALESVVIGSGMKQIDYNAFYWCNKLESVRFTGDAPVIGDAAFDETACTVYYPSGNDSWTEEVRQNYGGELTWVALGAMTGIRVAEPVIFTGLNEDVSISDIVVYAVYEGDVEILIDSTELTVSDYSTATVGKKTVTVSYGGYTAELVIAVHEGTRNFLVDASEYPESEHNYADGASETKSLTVPGATSITLTFSEESRTEGGCDMIRIMDVNGTLLASYSGDLGGEVVTVPGDTVQIRLETDYSITYYGYSFSSITANVLQHNGEAVDAKAATCTEYGYNSAICCEICDQIIVYDYIPAMGHVYSESVTAPTPEADGYSTWTCENCGDSYNDNYVNYYNVANGTTGEVSWVLAYDGTLTISGDGYMQDYEYYWMPPWLYPHIADRYPVKYVVIEEGVRNVGSYAFQYAYELETVTLPNSVTNIDAGAFENCHKLTSVSFGNAVESVGDMAFRNCHSLESVTLPDSCSYIGANAFEQCFSLKSIVLPQLLQWIGYRTFSCCTALETIEIPANVEAIESYAFEGCGQLKNIYISESVTYIGSYAFSNCQQLEKLTVDGNNTAYCADEYGVLFTKDMTQLIQAPGGLEGVYNVPETVETIWEYAFTNCDKLTGVTIPEKVSYIDQGTFYSCDVLEDVTIPDSVTTIAYRAFAECVSLPDIQIPANVCTIVDYAFSECYSLDNITFTGDAPQIDDYVFSFVTASAFYPANNETWTTDVLRSYGGNLCWITAGDIGIAQQSAMGVAMVGDKAMFVVEAVGEGLEYQWQCRTSPEGNWKDSAADGNDTNILYINATFARNGYEYRCKITDRNGNEVYSNPAMLYVLGISIQPADVYTVEGEMPIFTVHASGRDLVYQWQFRSSKNGNWENTNAVGSDSPTLTVDAEYWRDGYQYRCVIVDTYFSMEFVSEAATLSVLSIVEPPVNRTVAIGNTALFEVVATGAELTYQWQCRTSSKGEWKDSGATGNKTNVLSIEATAARAGYQYRCIITDTAGNTETTNHVTLYVWGINTQPSSKTVKAGETAKFTVSAIGEELSYQWQYRTSFSGSWKNVSAASGKTATYSVKTESRHHGYQYRCRVTNEDGNTATSKTVTLYVLGINTQPSSKTVKAGETAKFTVTATGRELTYQWQYRTSSSGSWKNVSSKGTSSSYSVKAAGRHNGYQYRCRVTDASGNKVYSKTVTLHVLEIISQPTSKTVVAGKTAKFTVSAVGSSVKYQWQYRTSSSGSWKNVSSNGTSNSYSVKSAARHNGYQYRCRITDSAGNKAYTKTVTLYVLGIKTQPASKSVKVGATAKFTVSAVGKGITYQWQYRTSSSGSWKNVSSKGTAASYSVKAASRHNGYQYRCKITDSAGNVIYTNVVKLTVK